MTPALVPHVCQQVLGDDAIVVNDGGNSTIWGQFFHEVRVPNTMLGTPKMGMLGAGVAQALGAQVACPDRRVYCIIGDGAMGFHPQEIETAVRNSLPVIYLVLCDKQWGMVKMNQQFALKPLKTLVMRSLGPDETINADLGEIRFDALARSMGAHGERVADPAQLRPALERSLRAGRCAVIHVDVDPVKHLWAPNLKTFKDMHAEPGT
jgi:acetolactate synthase-1/2/3 large subunit